MCPWVTPDDPPDPDICIKVYCPAGADYEAALRGAILDLEREYNWEKVGTETPEDVAAAFASAFSKTLDWEQCSEGESESMIGMIFWWAKDVAPDGTLLCDGDVYDAVDYPELFAILGDDYGGTAPDTFAVPDLTNSFILGQGTELVGDAGGEDEVQLTVAELPAHQHLYNKGGGSGGVPASSPLATIRKIGTWLTDTAGSNFPHNNMPPYVALLPCIVAE